MERRLGATVLRPWRLFGLLWLLLFRLGPTVMAFCGPAAVDVVVASGSWQLEVWGSTSMLRPNVHTQQKNNSALCTAEVVTPAFSVLLLRLLSLL